MKKVSESITFTRDFNRIRQESLYDLSKDPIIKQFIHDHHISYETLENYWAELLEVYEDNHVCDNCLSLSSCKKTNRGLIKKLNHDNDRIYISLDYCQYGQSLEQDTQLLSHVLYSNISTDELLIPLKDNIYTKQANHLSDVNAAAMGQLFTHLDNTQGIYLYGDDGIGKTELLMNLLHEKIVKGQDVGVIHFPTFLMELKASFNRNEDDAYLKQVLDIPYLLIDGIGEENPTAFTRDEVLLTILSYRSINHLTTYITSEYSLEDLTLIYTLNTRDPSETLKSKRIVQKIQSQCEDIYLERL